MFENKKTLRLKRV